MLKARGKKLHDQFTTRGKATFRQPMRVPVARAWHDTSGVPEGDWLNMPPVVAVDAIEKTGMADRRQVVHGHDRRPAL